MRNLQQAYADMINNYKMLFGKREGAAYLLLRENDKFHFVKKYGVTL